MVVVFQRDGIGGWTDRYTYDLQSNQKGLAFDEADISVVTGQKTAICADCRGYMDQSCEPARNLEQRPVKPSDKPDCNSWHVFSASDSIWRGRFLVDW